jgi:hypothetical protein
VLPSTVASDTVSIIRLSHIHCSILGMKLFLTSILWLLTFCLQGILAVPLNEDLPSLSVPLGQANFTRTVSKGLWQVFESEDDGVGLM